MTGLHPLRTHRCVHLLDDQNPPVAAGQVVYSVCGIEVPPLDPDGGPPGIETTRMPEEATCPDCTGPLAYTWWRVVAIICDIDIEGGAWRSPEEAWHSFFDKMHRHGVQSVGYQVVRATTRRAAAEAQPRPRRPWGHPPQRKRIGRGRWQRHDWRPRALIGN